MSGPYLGVSEEGLQLSELRDSGSELSGLRTQEDDEATPKLGVISDPILNYSLQLAGDSQPTAPVSLPDRESLTVTLVPTHQLHRLEELREDASQLRHATSGAVGVLVGFVTNVVIAGATLGSEAKLLLGLLFLFAVFSFWKAWQFGSRAKQLRAKLLGDSDA